MVAHPGRPRREQRQVGATLPLEPKLRALQALPDLVVADRDHALLADVIGIGGQGRLLRLPELAERRRGGGVVPVAVDDHPVPDHIVDNPVNRWMLP